jgi:hypothetical protein
VLGRNASPFVGVHVAPLRPNAHFVDDAVLRTPIFAYRFLATFRGFFGSVTAIGKHGRDFKELR